MTPARLCLVLDGPVLRSLPLVDFLSPDLLVFDKALFSDLPLVSAADFWLAVPEELRHVTRQNPESLEDLELPLVRAWKGVFTLRSLPVTPSVTRWTKRVEEWAYR